MTLTKREALVRRAQPDEAEALNELITRSKSYWGYDRPFVEAYRSFLSLSPEAIEHNPGKLTEGWTNFAPKDESLH